MSWQAASSVVLALVLAAGFAWYERRRPPAKVVALVAAMAALAVVGRLAFAAIPNVKPTTDIVLFAGYALGGIPGFAVGAVTALVSNVFLGQGPWTVWQMAAWGGVGVAGALLARAAGGRELGRVPLAIACGVAGLAFGAVLDVYQWTLAARQDLPTYLAVSGSSLPYNLAHAIGNVAFCLILGPFFIHTLRRYRRRFEVTWTARAKPSAAAGAAGAAAAIIAAVAVITSLTITSTERADAAASPTTKAARYLAAAQNRDGGFGGGRGQRSNQLFTGWTALGLAAAGRNPRDVARPRGRAITTYLRRAGSIRDTGELERTILVLKAAGLSPRRFGGRDLVADLMRRRRRDGSWQGNVAFTAFAVFALRAAGDPQESGSVQGAARYLERAQNGDGGFGFVPSAESDVDDTGAVLQALAAAGRRDGAVGRKAFAYLKAAQNRDGGLGQSEGRASNAQSTAWAVQGLVAARLSPRSLGADPIRYLRRLQRRDGHISYSRASNQTPVWVTAQALMALRRKPFPLSTVPRKKRRARAAVAAAARRAGAAKAGRGRDQAESVEAPGAEERTVAPAPDAASTVAQSPTSARSDRPGDDRSAIVGAGIAVGVVAAALGALWLLRRRLRTRGFA